jgi:hypothetical protein
VSFLYGYAENDLQRATRLTKHWRDSVRNVFTKNYRRFAVPDPHAQVTRYVGFSG